MFAVGFVVGIVGLLCLLVGLAIPGIVCCLTGFLMTQCE